MDKKKITLEDVYNKFDEMCMEYTTEDNLYCHLNGVPCKYNEYCLESDGFIPYLMDNYNITLEEKC